MKKFLLVLLLLPLFNMHSNAQAIANGDFENWTTYPGTNIQDPNFWLSTNLIYLATAYTLQETLQTGLDVSAPGATATVTIPPSVLKVSGRSGNYALKAQNVEMTTTINYIGSGTTTELESLAGSASIYSTTSQGDTVEGIPLSSSPSVLSGYYEFNQGSTDPSLLDTAEISILLTKWNSETMESDSIGGGDLYITNTVSSWTPFNINIANTSGLQPDSAFIGFLSTNTDSCHKNTYLIIDALSFSNLSAIVSSNEQSAVEVYPNPATEGITLANMPTGTVQVKVWDVMGNNIADLPVNEAEININVSSFTPGLYIFNLLDKNGALLKTSRFEVKR